MRLRADAAKHYAVLLAVVIGTAIVLSKFGQVPYIFTIAGFAAWAFFGHLITADDDAPGGWSNPDGKAPFPWAELFVKAAVFAALVAAAIAFPELRNIGAQ